MSDSKKPELSDQDETENGVREFAAQVHEVIFGRYERAYEMLDKIPLDDWDREWLAEAEQRRLEIAANQNSQPPDTDTD